MTTLTNNNRCERIAMHIKKNSTRYKTKISGGMFSVISQVSSLIIKTEMSQQSEQGISNSLSIGGAVLSASRGGCVHREPSASLRGQPLGPSFGRTERVSDGGHLYRGCGYGDRRGDLSGWSSCFRACQRGSAHWGYSSPCPTLVSSCRPQTGSTQAPSRRSLT